MSNKDQEKQEKLDGVFDTASEKPAAARPDKPARPAKPKVSLTRETKVGLAVIAALLVIFVVVLVLRFRGDPGEKVAGGNTSSNGGAGTEKPTKEQQKPATPESRTLIASQSNARSQPQYLFDGSNDTAKNTGSSSPGGGAFGSGATGGNRTPRSGSAYGGLASANDDGQARGDTPAGYLPPNMGQGSPLGVGASELQAGGGAGRGAESTLQLNQPDMGKQTSGAINRHSPLTKTGFGSADASASDEEVAGDEADPDDVAATQAGAASADPFSKRPTGQSVTGLTGTSPIIGTERRQEIQPRSTPATQGFGIAHGQTNTDETDLGEAEKFDRSGFGSGTGTNRLVGNATAANAHDDGDEVDADRKVNRSKLTSVKGIDLSERQPNLAAAEGDLPADSTLPFRKPAQSAAAPAPLDDAVFEGTGQAPEPIQRDASGDLGRSYAVAANDTYWTIAKKTYGTGAYFKALYEHNRRQSNHAGSLRPGMQMTLPDEATLQRLYPTLCPRPQRLAAAARATRASATLPGTGHEHVVNEGDTLYDVARRRLGNAKRWAEIYELNRDAIGAASDRLEPGTRLALPAPD